MDVQEIRNDREDKASSPPSAPYLECLTSQPVCLLHSGFLVQLLPITKEGAAKGRPEPAVNIVNTKGSGNGRQSEFTSHLSTPHPDAGIAEELPLILIRVGR